MGNLLKGGRGFLNTLSTSVSADCFRWFCSRECGRQIWGWDATNGYLHTGQRIPVYAYPMSHYKFPEVGNYVQTRMQAAMFCLANVWTTHQALWDDPMRRGPIKLL